MKYLPEFGWRPLVLTPRVDAVQPITLDHSLNELVPQGALVERTSVLRPLVSAKTAIRSLLKPWRNSNSGVNGNHTASTEKNNENGNSPQKRGMFSKLAESLEHWSAIPDRHIGWFPPAVVAALSIIRRQHPQVIYTSGPPHSSHLIGAMLKKLTGLPLVTDFRDPWTRTQWKPDHSSRYRDSLEHKLERFCVCASDAVILNTTRLREDFQNAYSTEPGSKFYAIPNGFDPDQLRSITELVHENSHCHTNGSIHLCHTGTLYGRRDLRPIAAAVGRLAASGYQITLEQIGDVGQRTQLLDFLRENRLEDCVQLQDQMPHDQMLRRLARADLLVIIQPDTKIQVPAKLFEMMMFGKPMVALTEEGSTADIILKYNLGVTAPSSDMEKIASAIVEAAGKQNDENFRLGWKAALDAFNGRNLTFNLAAILKTVTQNTKAASVVPLV